MAIFRADFEFHPKAPVFVTMDVFTFRDRLVTEYQRFTRSFMTIRATDIKAHVDREYEAERLGLPC
jgi:hypothetical protein